MFDRQLNLMKSQFDKSGKQLYELTEKMRATNQRFAGLKHKSRQPRLAMEADVTPDKGFNNWGGQGYDDILPE